MKAKAQQPLIAQQIAAQKKRGERPAAIFTDLDGTFVITGNNVAADAANAVFQQAHAADWPIIAITGRSTARIIREVLAGELPPFSALVGAVGTEISLRHGDAYELDAAYARELAPLYDRDAVEQLSLQAAALAPKHLKLQFFPKEPLEPYKVSYKFVAPNMAADIVAALEPFQRMFPQLKLIVCEDYTYNLANPDKTTRYNLDIVPASKSDAVKHLMKQYGIERGIVAGDSGNDVDALLVPGLIAVLVGGHRQEAVEVLTAEFPGMPLGAFHQAGDKHVLVDTHPTRLGPESILLAMDYLRSDSASA